MSEYPVEEDEDVGGGIPPPIATIFFYDFLTTPHFPIEIIKTNQQLKTIPKDE